MIIQSSLLLHVHHVTELAIQAIYVKKKCSMVCFHDALQHGILINWKAT
jgi:hypothetical protein